MSARGLVRCMLVGSAVMLLVSSCSSPAAHKASHAGASRSMVQSEAPAADWRKEEVRDLWIQIRAWRVDLGLGADVPHALVDNSEGADHVTGARPADSNGRVPIDALRRCEREPTTDTCQEICTLKDAICDNAERICELADDLGDDPWADDKCESARGSCREATEQCCGCAANESPAAIPAANTE